MRQLLLTFTLLLSAFCLNTSSQHLVTGGEVVDVIDGKTIIVATQTGRVKVELQFIEVPEPEQQMHETVKAHLRQLVIGKVVEYKFFRLYEGHTLGRVTLKGVDISQQMLRDGAAWHIPFAVAGQDKPEHDVYAATEAAAKSENRGIWSAAGLKPAWEFRAERNARRAQEQNASKRTPETVERPRSKPTGYWGDVNPLIGEVGALSHGYNATKRLGYVSTLYGGVEQTDEDKSNNRIMALDITYHYKEEIPNGRTGLFIITVISTSPSARFARSNDLFLMEEKRVLIGKAKRTVSSRDDMVQERLIYTVERHAIEKLINGTANLSIGGNLVKPTGFAYSIMHNMLQISGKTQLASVKDSKRKPSSN